MAETAPDNSAPKGTPGDPLSVQQTDRGTAENPVVVQPTSDVPTGTAANPVTVKQEADIPRGTAADPVIVKDNRILMITIIAGVVTAAISSAQFVAVAWIARPIAQSVEKTEKKVDKTLLHVNSMWGSNLRALAVSYRKEANRTGDDVDIKMAEAAEKDYEEHMRGQAQADKVGNP